MRCETAHEVIETLGGRSAFAEWFGVDPRTVTMWRVRGFPANTYLVMTTRLKREKRIEVPPSAWGMIEVDEAS
ncbi:MAG: hypothetical protein GEU91_18650 [Rhizobiales bacterium]|nr:hypothetical protein [Hyphomicrobiales bacterium]